MLTVALIALGSIFAGIWGSLLGLGGGIILIPMLTLIFKMPIHTAIGASIVGVIATSTGSSITYVRQGRTDIRLGMTLELATTIGAISGALLAGFFSQNILYMLFAVLLIYITFSMARQKETAATLDQSRPANSYINLPSGLGASGLAGVMSGLLGIGGGIIKIPTMYILMRVPLPVAIATSNFMIGVTGTASALIYFSRGDIHPLVAAPAALGIFAGATIGAKISHKVPKDWLRWLFVAVALYTALQMLFKGLHINIALLGGS